jgi:hypothetical protein
MNVGQMIVGQMNVGLLNATLFQLREYRNFEMRMNFK